jgi:hypothetical protein
MSRNLADFVVGVAFEVEVRTAKRARHCRASIRGVGASWLSSLCGENRLLHTKTPSVPGLQKKTNGIGLAATSKGDTRNGA